jgi:hypothetical protein
MQRGIAALGLALTLSSGLAGCLAQDGTDQGILVLKNVAPMADSCSTMVAADEIGLTHGAIDTQLPRGYIFIAQMKSRITALAGTEDQRTILLSGARVDIRFPDSSFFSAAELARLADLGLTKFRTLFTAPIEPNGGITDAGFELIPAALVAQINAKSDQPFAIEMLATFVVEGDMSGQHVESNAFTYPITIGHSVTINVRGTCPLPKGTMVQAGSSCNFTQDGSVDCCTDPRAVSATNPRGLVCPAEVATDS